MAVLANSKELGKDGSQRRNRNEAVNSDLRSGGYSAATTFSGRQSIAT